MTQAEKIVKIITPDLLKYLEMVESGESIEKRLEKNNLLAYKEEKEGIKERVYYYLMINHLINFYVKASDKVIFNSGWSWIVVFESMNRHNYYVVKF